MQPGLLGYCKEREGILSAPLMPPKIPEVRAGEGVWNRGRERYKLDVLRQRWEETRYTSIKQILVTYNREDCEALKWLGFAVKVMYRSVKYLSNACGSLAVDANLSRPLSVMSRLREKFPGSRENNNAETPRMQSSLETIGLGAGG